MRERAAEPCAEIKQHLLTSSGHRGTKRIVDREPEQLARQIPLPVGRNPGIDFGNPIDVSQPKTLLDARVQLLRDGIEQLPYALGELIPSGIACRLERHVVWRHRDDPLAVARLKSPSTAGRRLPDRRRDARPKQNVYGLRLNLV